jgi:hypothetical protein
MKLAGQKNEDSEEKVKVKNQRKGKEMTVLVLEDKNALYNGKSNNSCLFFWVSCELSKTYFRGFFSLIPYNVPICCKSSRLKRVSTLALVPDQMLLPDNKIRFIVMNHCNVEYNF